jgi:hypothetical protein
MATLWGGREVIEEDGCGRRWWLMDYLVSSRMIGVMDRRWVGGAKHENWQKFLVVTEWERVKVKAIDLAY